VSKKTGKREFAGFLVIIWLGLVGTFLWTEDQKYWTVATTIMPYVLVIAGGAFGLDSLAKQVRR
jgi:hypothetical protein